MIRYLYASAFCISLALLLFRILLRTLHLDGEGLQVLIVRDVGIDAFSDDLGTFLSILLTPLLILNLNSLRLLPLAVCY